MVRTRPFVSLALAGTLLIAATARAQSSLPESLHYVLDTPPSLFEWGCFAPCECPIQVQSSLSGSFELHRTSIGPLFTSYDVTDVHWKSTSDVRPVVITGSGTYRRGGEVALVEQFTLDLSFNGGPVQHFDSGLRPPSVPFPAIDTRISLHGEFCVDSVLAIVAKPPVASVTGGPVGPTLTLTPNPFSNSTAVDFVLPRDGVVDVAVFDITGRRVRSLAGNEWLAAGSYARTWDGRLESGAAATPGLYLVRLSTAAGRTARTAIRLP